MRSSWSSLTSRIILRRMFSEKITDGASSVPLAVLMITESRAPKNTTCASGDMWSRIRRGRMCCGSASIRLSTAAGSISVAE